MCHGSDLSFTCLSKISLSVGFGALSVKNINHVSVVCRPCLLNTSKYNVCYKHVHLQLYNFFEVHPPIFRSFYSFLLLKQDGYWAK